MSTPREMTLREAVQLLYSNGITNIRIDYSGSGDSGDVGSIEYFIKQKKVKLREISTDPIRIADMVGKKAAANLKGRKSRELELEPIHEYSIEAIETALNYATDLIDGDWYNNEGGQGTILINAKTLEVEINAEFNVVTQTNEHQTRQL